MIEPRGRVRRGCVVEAGAAVLVGVAGAGVPGVPAAGVLSCAKTARAASRAASVWAGAGARRTVVVGLAAELERACKIDEFGVICMMIKFYANAPKIPLIADLSRQMLGNKPLRPGVYAVSLIWRRHPADRGSAYPRTVSGRQARRGRG